MSQTANSKIAIYSTSDLYPLFEYMHKQISIFSDRFKEQNEIARTIWLAMRIDGEIKNGGIEQLFSNLGESFDPSILLEVLKNIKSQRGFEIVKEFIDFIHQTEQHKTSFYGEYAYVAGFDKKLKKLHNELSDEYYRLDPSVEALIVQYAEANWNDAEFQHSIRDVVFQSADKDESELIGDLNDAIKSGNVSTTKKILKNLKNVNQACKYGFVPMLELVYAPSSKQIELCQLMLGHGADLQMRDKYQNTVLHKAAANNNTELIEFLLDKGMDIEIADDYKNTPIFNTDTSPESSAILIKRGANLNVLNKIGFSPLTKIMNNYHGWYGNQHAKKYQPKIKKTMDQFLAAGATFNPGMLIHENTELSLFVEDAKMMKHLLKQKTVRAAPEFDPEYRKWSAVFEASFTGNLESLQPLAEKGAHLSQALDVAHYLTKTHIGATPFNVAKNEEIKDYLTKEHAAGGSRKGYALYLETRGNDERSVLQLIQETKNVNEEEAVKQWNTVKKKMNESYERIDGNFIIYRPLFLKSTESEEEIKNIESEFRKFDCEMTLI